ncbi:MAG: hypothetical protein HC896_12705 [Bacteroidales bacterium]|nr:hypothetical protein [Bacteroidales bacterium]
MLKTIFLNIAVNIRFNQLPANTLLLKGLQNSLVLNTGRKFKGNGLKALLNPFYSNIPNEELVTRNHNLRNTLGFKHPSKGYGADYIYSHQQQLQTLFIGREERNSTSNELVVSWNIQQFNLKNAVLLGNKEYSSEIGENRNYQIEYLQNQLSLAAQFSKQYSGEINYVFHKKKTNGSRFPIQYPHHL